MRKGSHPPLLPLSIARYAIDENVLLTKLYQVLDNFAIVVLSLGHRVPVLKKDKRRINLVILDNVSLIGRVVCGFTSGRKLRTHTGNGGIFGFDRLESDELSTHGKK